MPVSVIVGGQYGSEGKGKVALELVRRNPSVTVAVRPGGTNSGHTAYTKAGQRFVLRQLPAAAVDGGVKVVLPPGSYIDVALLKREIASLRLSEADLIIDPRAHVISQEHVAWERDAALTASIGSTGSGTGAAVISRLARMARAIPPATVAGETSDLLPYLGETSTVLRKALADGDRVLIEGTQGFGLSPLHGEAWPKATSRDTTAAAFLSEAGLGPTEVDEVILVIRCHPIRVAGDSGPLVGETDWLSIALTARAPRNLEELTSVTRKLRRVGHFDSSVVKKAIAANSPTKIVLNHLDYIDWGCRAGQITDKAREFIAQVEQEIGAHVDMAGINETKLVELDRQVLA